MRKTTGPLATMARWRDPLESSKPEDESRSRTLRMGRPSSSDQVRTRTWRSEMVESPPSTRSHDVCRPMTTCPPGAGLDVPPADDVVRHHVEPVARCRCGPEPEPLTLDRAHLRPCALGRERRAAHAVVPGVGVDGARCGRCAGTGKRRGRAHDGAESTARATPDPPADRGRLDGVHQNGAARRSRMERPARSTRA